MTISELLTNIINSRDNIRTALINKHYLESDSTAVLSQLAEICNTIYDKNIVDEIVSNQSSSTYVKRTTGEIEKYDIEGKLTSSSISNKSTISNLIIGKAVTSIGNSAFEDCSNLTSITIPSSVTEIGAGAFEDCLNLTSIEIPEGVTLIDSRVFQNCTSLTSVTILLSVTSIGDRAFYGCERLTSIYFKGEPPTVGTDAFMTNNSNTIGYYLPEYATEWEAALEADGTWNGMTMQQLNTEN